MKYTFRTFCFSLFTFTFLCVLSGCLPAPHYQKEEAIPQNAWTYNFKPTFKFEITDTTVNYQTFFLIRHTQAYPYSNLWVLIYIKTPGDSTIKKARVNIPLAEASGKWLGRGMGEIYEQCMLLNLSDVVTFNKKGAYQVSLEQNMRINPLPEIMDVGLRIEKTTPRMR